VYLDFFTACSFLVVDHAAGKLSFKPEEENGGTSIQLSKYHLNETDVTSDNTIEAPPPEAILPGPENYPFEDLLTDGSDRRLSALIPVFPLAARPS
jgi:hypothetical protein